MLMTHLPQDPADSTSGALQDALDWLSEPTFAAQAVGLLIVVVSAYVIDKIARQVLLTTVGRLTKRTAFQWDDKLRDFGVFSRLAHLAPAIAIYYGIELLPNLSEGLTTLVTRSAAAAIILVLLHTASAFLSAANAIYSETPTGRERPIVVYLQVLRIALYVFGGIVILSTLLGRSPTSLLAGIGALTAVLLLVFRDTILSFVASIQLSNYDMVRVGDWIEVPQYGADGDVIDIALHAIKVQNWDKTISTIPTYKLVDGSFKNWRSMPESGGRRIKRALHIDMNTIRFLGDEDLARFERFALLRDYIREKKEQLATDWDRLEDPDMIVNARRLTNIGTFRVYVVNYLRQRQDVHPGMTLMVRQRDPTPDGLPLEVYAFSNVTSWVEYEGIQSDIFDHILAIAPEFGLRVFQHPAGRDFEAAMARN
ncbi:MAG: mechanosensitive ion channel [Gemmatimonadales bacterium]|jgi:miniconductance mechanosensitive channel